MSSSWKRVWSKAEIWSRDSWQLASAMIRSVPLLQRSAASAATTTSSIRDVVVQHARHSNVAAISLMHVDREVGLLRYWGFSGYLREKKVGWNHWELTRRWFYQTPPAADQPMDPSKFTTTITNNQNQKKPKARVAFMVTAAMRQELTERLAYSEEQIKKLTPLQASLVLQHDVPSHQVESKLPELEDAHFEMQEAANQLTAAVAAAATTTPTTTTSSTAPTTPTTSDPSLVLVAEEDKNELEEQQAEKKEESKEGGDHDNDDEGDEEGYNNTKASKHGPNESFLNFPSSTTLSSGMATEQLLPLGIPFQQAGVSFLDSIVDPAKASPDKIWYELIEHDSDNRESSVVGLYRDVVEAQLALETRQLFERRRAKDKHRPVTTSFVITRVLR